jgi:hypothetical protein
MWFSFTIIIKVRFLDKFETKKWLQIYGESVRNFGTFSNVAMFRWYSIPESINIERRVSLFQNYRKVQHLKFIERLSPKKASKYMLVANLVDSLFDAGYRDYLNSESFREDITYYYLGSYLSSSFPDYIPTVSHGPLGWGVKNVIIVSKNLRSKLSRSTAARKAVFS